MSEKPESDQGFVVTTEMVDAGVEAYRAFSGRDLWATPSDEIVTDIFMAMACASTQPKISASLCPELAARLPSLRLSDE